MQNLTLRDLDQALKEYKVENEDGVEFTVSIKESYLVSINF